MEQRLISVSVLCWLVKFITTLGCLVQFGLGFDYSASVELPSDAFKVQFDQRSLLIGGDHKITRFDFETRKMMNLFNLLPKTQQNETRKIEFFQIYGSDYLYTITSNKKLPSAKNSNRSDQAGKGSREGEFELILQKRYVSPIRNKTLITKKLTNQTALVFMRILDSHLMVLGYRNQLQFLNQTFDLISSPVSPFQHSNHAVKGMEVVHTKRYGVVYSLNSSDFSVIDLLLYKVVSAGKHLLDHTVEASAYQRDGFVLFDQHSRLEVYQITISGSNQEKKSRRGLSEGIQRVLSDGGDPDSGSNSGRNLSVTRKSEFRLESKTSFRLGYFGVFNGSIYGVAVDLASSQALISNIDAGVVERTINLGTDLSILKAIIHPENNLLTLILGVEPTTLEIDQNQKNFRRRNLNQKSAKNANLSYFVVGYSIPEVRNCPDCPFCSASGSKADCMICSGLNYFWIENQCLSCLPTTSNREREGTDSRLISKGADFGSCGNLARMDFQSDQMNYDPLKNQFEVSLWSPFRRNGLEVGMAIERSGWPGITPRKQKLQDLFDLSIKGVARNSFIATFEEEAFGKRLIFKINFLGNEGRELQNSVNEARRSLQAAQLPPKTLRFNIDLLEISLIAKSPNMPQSVLLKTKSNKKLSSPAKNNPMKLTICPKSSKKKIQLIRPLSTKKDLLYMSITLLGKLTASSFFITHVGVILSIILAYFFGLNLMMDSVNSFILVKQLLFFGMLNTDFGAYMTTFLLPLMQVAELSLSKPAPIDSERFEEHIIARGSSRGKLDALGLRVYSINLVVWNYALLGCLWFLVWYSRIRISKIRSELVYNRSKQLQ